MSLRRRIAIAAALAVAAVAVAISVVGYLTTRSHLVGELQHELRERAQPFLQPHHRASRGQPPGVPRGGEPSGRPDHEPRAFVIPPAPEFGGAPGYFQVVHSDGTTAHPSGERIALPVDPRMVEIARRARGSLFTSTTVNGVHLEVLTVGDPYDHWAVQVALPLTGVDSILNGLLLPYGVLIAGGVLLAALLGLTISRAALAPIEGFLRRTEDVTSELERPRRLEETGPTELHRLAASFNQTLDALERSMEAQRNLVADASHELRTPIAALRSNIQIFLESERLPVEDRETLQGSILAELDELTQIVANVLELAGGSAPGARAEPVELDGLVYDVVQRARRRAPGIEFNLQLEPTVVKGDPDRITRAITNVVDNARKWSPPEGAIDVRLHGGSLSVRDHGPGFSEADLPHVFDRFYRAAHARRMPGSGLGLAIVRQTAVAHEGEARASNAPGGGALLEVSFGPPVKLGVVAAAPERQPGVGIS
ncbi:MAG: HAMP domain-containing histidine kinase [Solirubrobacterales bacterium]|nr:HAMP domain-containing histidine kinase [Solirubrobacterales bacterium]